MLRQTIAIALTLVLACVCTAGRSAPPGDDFPSRPLRLVCPWPAGGLADLRSRQVGDRLSKALGQPVVVENRPGASGTVGVTAVTLAKPDGYTIVLGSINDLAIAPALDGAAYGRLLAGLQPLTLTGRGPMILIASPGVPAKTVTELIALARSKPGQLSYGTAGPNTTHHFAGELFKRTTGTDLIHVPYKGIAQMSVDLAAGNVAVGFDFAATTEPLVKAGRIRALAVLGPRRVSLLPDVPTAREAGIGEVEIMSWGGFFVPAGTPQPIVARLHEELVKILRAPDMVQLFTQAGYEVMATTSEESLKFVREEQARWARLAKELGMTP
jgi:tripartite-type tricarboxylate transporter receptor subunit TctC